MQHCLVTGGAGFIGSHLVESLVELGHSVTVLDNFSSGSRENLERVEKRVQIIAGEITDQESLSDAMRGVDFVFHLAGPAEEIDAHADPLETHRSGATGTLSVLLCARQANVRRVIYSSSCTIYGFSKGSPRCEHETIQPLTHYAVAKLTGEQHCVSVFAMEGLETVRLRYFHVYGPRQNPKNAYTPQLAQILENMVAGRRPMVQANNLDPQDLVFVDDVSHANILAATAPRVAGRVFNIATGRPTTSLDLVNTVNRILGTRLTPLGVNHGRSDGMAHLADITRAEIDLGFCPSTDLEQGLRRCVEHIHSQAKHRPALEKRLCC